MSLKDSRVQTWLTGKAAAWISEKTGAVASVAAVDIEFFKTVVIQGVYLEDLQKDTLLYTDAIKVKIELFNFRENKLFFSSIILEQAEINIKIQKGEEKTNFQFLIDAFQNEDTSSVSPWKIDLANLEIINSKFSYLDKNMPSQEFGVNYWDIRADNINLKLTDINLKGDTILAHIQNISLKEKSGFILNNLSADASVCSSELALNKLFIKTPGSEVKTNMVFNYEQWA
ncbi:MAG: hypothetical protein M3Q58_10100, partial [Bacteroidota bacterium]|nr:hypothetical protein [Bacteroidota bacterium]